MKMRVERRGGRRACDALAGKAVARAFKRQGSLPANIPASPLVRTARLGKFSGRQPICSPKIGFTSRGAAIRVRNSGSIRENIIGHRMSRPSQRLSVWRGLLGGRRAVPLLHQPTREHGRRVFIQILVEKRADFLTEIGGMTKPREFVALERNARSREKELPRGLDPGLGHMGLLKDEGTLTVYQVSQ